MDINITPIELSEFIGEIYDAALTGNWSEVLDKFIDITQSNKAFFFLQKLDSVQPLILEIKTNFEHSQQAVIEYQSRIEEDPFYSMTKMIPEGEFVNYNDYVDISQHENTEYYKTILKPMKSHYILAGILCRDGIHESCFVINRGNDQFAYSVEDTNLVKLITPHFSRAMHIFKELRLYRNYANISKCILDNEDKAILVCDESSRIIISNEYANHKLLSPCNVVLEKEKLKLSSKDNQQQLERYISQCTKLAFSDIGTQETLTIEGNTIEGTSESILITVSPLQNKNSFNNIDIPCCVVTINFQHQLDWNSLQKEFVLTPKELQLLKAIYTKKRLFELTSVFNVSYNTLRTHLQTIFRKTGVNSQTELMVKINLFK